MLQAAVKKPVVNEEQETLEEAESGSVQTPVVAGNGSQSPQSNPTRGHAAGSNGLGNAQIKSTAPANKRNASDELDDLLGSSNTGTAAVKKSPVKR